MSLSQKSLRIHTAYSIYSIFFFKNLCEILQELIFLKSTIFVNCSIFPYQVQFVMANHSGVETTLNDKYTWVHIKEIFSYKL